MIDAFVRHYGNSHCANFFARDGAASGTPEEAAFPSAKNGTRTASPTTAFPAIPLDSDLYRARVEGSQVYLSFDPTETVNDLRNERYAHANQHVLGKSFLVRKAYYSIRSLIPVSLRKHLQRLVLSRWERLIFPNWPVDFTVEDVLEQLMALAIEANGGEPIPFIWFWPDGASAAAILTHDVETPQGLDFCPAVMDIGQSHGIPSSFQLIPEGGYDCPPELLDTIRRRGFELNIHDLNHDGQLFDDRQTFLERAQRINTHASRVGALGFRSGRMYRQSDWYDALKFSYDMSVPNVAHLEPQRGGCCTALPYFIGDVLELPLTTVEDYTLFYILRERNIDLWRLQGELIRLRHGLISFMVHPDYIQGTHELRMYEDLMEYISGLRDQHGVWTALPREVDEWWRNRTSMTLTGSGKDWKIEGKDSQRACLAYASLQDGKLVYSVAADGRSQSALNNGMRSPHRRPIRTRLCEESS
ncbi:MAG TPA: hypothetical protein VG892_12140 [Terriglobales bacterium]|nr:hypothetical protein [Terriglobales bacterium]